MEKAKDIFFVKNNDIDRTRWDDCIDHAANSLIYARTFYLDSVCNEWDGLTGEQYEWVFPLTSRKKYGISYLFQPAFMQQSGVFFKPGVNVPYKEIVQYLQEHYRFCEINWNFLTPPILTALPLEIKTANNFVLELSSSFETIGKNYHNDLVKNLKRSKRFKLNYGPTNDYSKCIKLYKDYYGKRMPQVKAADYDNFSQACYLALRNDMLVCREVLSEHNTLLATALLLFDGKRLYNIMNTTTEAGRKAGANHFLLNALIEEFSEKNILLDFEGSDLPGVKSFYENFGALNQPYFKWKYNCLPWPINLFKK